MAAYINTSHAHLGDFINGRDGVCSFPGANYKGYIIEPCLRPIGPGCHDTIYPFSTRVDLSKTTANKHHIYPRKSDIFHFFASCVLNNIPVGTDPAILVNLLPLGRPWEHLNMFDQRMKDLFSDPAQVAELFYKYRLLIDAALNDPRNIVNICAPDHLSIVHPDNLFINEINWCIGAIQEGIIVPSCTEYHNGNIPEIVRRIKREGKQIRQGYKGVSQIKLLQVFRTIATNAGQSYVDQEVAGQMFWASSARTQKMFDEHRQNGVLKAMAGGGVGLEEDVQAMVVGAMGSAPVAHPQRISKTSGPIYG